MNSTSVSSSLTIDLHVHSTCSDGWLTPEEVVALGAAQGLNIFALTDHDTLDGIEAAKAASSQAEISFIPGIEISSVWKNTEVHIVGLGVESEAAALSQGVAELRESRRERTHKIIKKLIRAGVSSEISTIIETYGRDHLTRSHFARHLTQLGVCKSEDEAFRRYLGRQKPAFVSSGWVDYIEAVRWIREAGGIAVLAHPQHYRLTETKLNRLLEEFIEVGGEGMEIQPVRATPEVRTQMLRIFKKHPLLASVGSDFHGESYQLERFGSEIPVPEEVATVWHDPRITAYLTPEHRERI